MDCFLEATVITFFFLSHCEKKQNTPPALFPPLSLISSYFNYTTVIKQDISSGDLILRCFCWPPRATPELSQIC